MADQPQAPHRRYNPLTQSWVLVSPHRLDRPWQGETEQVQTPPRAPYDPQCYLCPGNMRANGERNPEYAATHVFENDFPALRAQTAAGRFEDGLLCSQGEPGVCRVLCFSPRHDLDVANMNQEQMRAVVDAWAQQYAELRALPFVNAVTIFENRGSMMGASNPHPHCQIWAQASVPSELERETRALAAHRERTGACLLCAYAEQERRAADRVVYDNGGVLVVVPFWAEWPFETLVIPQRHAPSLDRCGDPDREALAGALRELTARYDRLFATPFPYTMGFHQQPGPGAAADEAWHVHAHYYPPLLRSAHVRKFAVGYEMLAQPQRDITPEEAADRLRRA